MLKGFYNLCIKTMAILLVCVFIAPLAFKFIHEVSHEHEIETCENHEKTHLHELENDCDFCKFKLNSDNLFILSSHQNSILGQLVFSTNKKLYSYTHNHQNLSYLLRGPPRIG